MNVNISWFNILVLKLFSNKNGLMAKLYTTLIVVAMSNSQCVNRGRACIVDYSEYYMSV